MAGVLHKGPHSEVCFLRALSNSAQKVNAAQGGKWGGENYVLPYKDLFEFSPLCLQRGMHTHLAQHWLTTLETHFALQPVTPDLGDKGLVCWCAGRAGPDVRNGRAVGTHTF